MSDENFDDKQIGDLLLHQLRSFWCDVDEELIRKALPKTMEQIEEGFRGSPSKRFYDGKNIVFSPYMSIHWMIFMYRLSHHIFLLGGGKTADQIYYLNKIMHGVDWFYEIDLPIHFLVEHPVGSVLGRAKYGDYFFVYQGTTVGGNRSKSQLCYPTIGNNVIMFANATILGDAHIGNNVVISSGAYIINEDVPDNCIVFGKSPNLAIKRKNEPEIKKYTQNIWGWRIEE